MSIQQIITYIVLAFGLSVILTPLLILFLKKFGAGQNIREEGPSSHISKTGTPTMGGIAILFATIIPLIALGNNGTDLWIIILTCLAFALVGFADDFVKVFYKRNLGLTARQKLALQVFIAIILAVYQSRASQIGTCIYIPILKIYADFGILYIPFVVFVVVAMVNAVNLTDGLDGLAAGITAIVAACLMIIGYRSGYLASTAFTACIVGACIGFLVYNKYPAKVFMGDTGSLALGGGLAACAILMNMEFILPLAGGIYVAEALSVVIQVIVFKTQNERRFFRMAPLHHHFELGGWSETKVVYVFYLVTFLLSIVALLIV